MVFGVIAVSGRKCQMKRHKLLLNNFMRIRFKNIEILFKKRLLNESAIGLCLIKLKLGLITVPPTAGHIALKDFIVKTTEAFLTKILLEAGH